MTLSHFDCFYFTDDFIEFSVKSCVINVCFSGYHELTVFKTNMAIKNCIFMFKSYSFWRKMCASWMTSGKNSTISQSLTCLLQTFKYRSTLEDAQSWALLARFSRCARALMFGVCMYFLCTHGFLSSFQKICLYVFGFSLRPMCVWMVVCLPRLALWQLG